MTETTRASDPQQRLRALHRLLSRGQASTQEELREQLERQGFEVNQSTVSRMLRRIGAAKVVNDEGRTAYRLPPEESWLPAPARASLAELVLDIASNGSIIVLRTSPGSASLVARQLDHARPGKLLGTIAGDDTVFVAPASAPSIPATIRAIRETLEIPADSR